MILQKTFRISKGNTMFKTTEQIQQILAKEALRYKTVKVIIYAIIFGVGWDIYLLIKPDITLNGIFNTISGRINFFVLVFSIIGSVATLMFADVRRDDKILQLSPLNHKQCEAVQSIIKRGSAERDFVAKIFDIRPYIIVDDLTHIDKFVLELAQNDIKKFVTENHHGTI